MDEWFAWRVICRLLAQRGINVNAKEHEDLIRAIRHYANAYRQLYGANREHPQAAQDAARTRALYLQLGALLVKLERNPQ